MDNKLPLVSYALAALSGVCFVGGLVILSGEGRIQTCTDLRKSYPHWTNHLVAEKDAILQEECY